MGTTRPVSGGKVREIQLALNELASLRDKVERLQEENTRLRGLLPNSGIPQTVSPELVALRKFFEGAMPLIRLSVCGEAVDTDDAAAVLDNLPRDMWMKYQAEHPDIQRKPTVGAKVGGLKG